MSTPIQRLLDHVMLWPISHFLLKRGPAPEPARASDDVDLDGVPVTFKECEGECGPTVQQIKARERDRAEQFKRDQLLPIMGLGGGSPSPPS